RLGPRLSRTRASYDGSMTASARLAALPMLRFARKSHLKVLKLQPRCITSAPWADRSCPVFIGAGGDDLVARHADGKERDTWTACSSSARARQARWSLRSAP